jgi:conjugative transfer signal peptidase TraF
MRLIVKRVGVGVAIACGAFLVTGAVLYLAGARINTTRSIPVGLYWVTDAPAEKGFYVMFCPPKVGVFDDARERGYIGAGMCPGGYGYMMKRILAAKNDSISIADDGVRVNGNLLPFSMPRKFDAAGRVMPRFQANRYTLGDSELLLMSDVSATSFDSRYFGPISRAQIKAVIRPVITW